MPGPAIQPVERERILHALAQGESIERIAKRLHHHNRSVIAVRDEQWKELAMRKQILAAQAERGALLAGNRLLERIPYLEDNILLPTFGVFVDKAIALRGDLGTLHIQHDHTLSISGDDLVSFALHKAKLANPNTLQNQSSQPDTLTAEVVSETTCSPIPDKKSKRRLRARSGPRKKSKMNDTTD